MKRVFFFLMLSVAAAVHTPAQIKLPVKPVKLPPPVDSFTVFPIDMAALKFITPLGNLNPPGHTFPTNHCYINLVNSSSETPVFAPGNIRLKIISRSQRFKENTTQLIGQDYTLQFAVNAAYYIRFDHLSALAPDISNLITSAIENSCNIYTTGGVTYKQCSQNVDMQVAAGTETGKIGGQQGLAGLDFGAFTNGVSLPGGVLCPFSFYKKAVFSQFKSKFGYPSKPRTAEPVCGAVDQEAGRTLKGRWLRQGQPYYPEDPHIAFVDDNFDPSVPVISVGNSQTGLSPNVYTYQKLLIFAATGNADINQSFTAVTANGKTHCFNLFLKGQAPATSSGSLIVKMLSNTTVDVEYRPGCNCACGKPYSFTDKKVRYEKYVPGSTAAGK